MQKKRSQSKINNMEKNAFLRFIILNEEHLIRICWVTFHTEVYIKLEERIGTTSIPKHILWASHLCPNVQ